MGRAMKKILAAALMAGMAQTALMSSTLAQEGPMPNLRPDQKTYLAMYKELVETNTTLSVGDCTLAATRLLAHMKAAGFSDADAQVFVAPGHPKEGGLTAILHGTSKTAKAITLLGHLDVVEAKRADWTRDPFKLIEENGYFYGRGTSDMKAMSAAWVDILDRFKQQNYRPKRDIKLALTCGEEGAPFDGANWLAQNQPDKVKAAFALNEGGGGRSDGHGKVVIESIQVGEKAFQDFRLETRNAGGHSSIPIKDNAIYELAQALLKVRDLEFPVHMSDTTKEFFAKAGETRDDPMGAAMMQIAKNPHDAAAEKIVSTDRSYHSMLRTTCVATLLDGGHADNALPQRAGANINCRIFPGETTAAVRAALVAAIGDPGVTVTATDRGTPRPLATPPPLDPKVVGPAEALVTKYYPGVPLIPDMSTGATDGIFLEQIGVPVYGVPNGWSDPDGNGTHGLNERRSVHSLFVGRDFLTDLVKSYSEAG
jgi:acetylornithine deacetylase/succinyl-diaminopimelate desuccinylase-like protein